MILDFKRNNNVEITPALNECYITLPINWGDDIKIILENSVYIYTNKYDVYTKSFLTDKHYLISNLKLNGRSTISASFHCKNIENNVKLLVGQDLVNILREITISKILE